MGTLIVKNGTIDGDNKITDAISSASIWVNGELIFGPSDFDQNIHLLQAPLNLTETDTITVELASIPGNFLTIEIIQGQQPGPPAITCSADPAAIMTGESSTLSWNSTNADSCEIDQGIGTVALNGSLVVSPIQTTTYTITATGPGGTATDNVTVTVTATTTYPPSITITEPDGTDDLADNIFIITWTDDDPDSNASIALYYDTDSTKAS